MQFCQVSVRVSIFMAHYRGCRGLKFLCRALSALDLLVELLNFGSPWMQSSCGEPWWVGSAGSSLLFLGFLLEHRGGTTESLKLENTSKILKSSAAPLCSPPSHTPHCYIHTCRCEDSTTSLGGTVQCVPPGWLCLSGECPVTSSSLGQSCPAAQSRLSSEHSPALQCAGSQQGWGCPLSPISHSVIHFIVWELLFSLLGLAQHCNHSLLVHRISL